MQRRRRRRKQLGQQEGQGRIERNDAKKEDAGTHDDSALHWCCCS